MSVIVTDTRFIWADGNKAGNPPGDWNTGEALSTVFAEGPTSIVDTLNITTGQLYRTGSPQNLSDTLIYVWSNNFALQDLWDSTDPPNALHLGDGTDRVSFAMAGINRKVFVHLDAGAGVNADWDCLVLDGSQAAAMDTAGLTTERAGTFASLDMTAITQIGSDFTTLSKGLGGGVNVATDIIRFGNDGLIISAGSPPQPGSFEEVIAEDSSSATGKAHGIIRELSTGLYSAQGPLNFGFAVGSPGDCHFEDANRVLSFEDRNISDDKYYIKVTGRAGTQNTFSLSSSTITSAGPSVKLNFDGGNINTLLLTGNSFANLGNPAIGSPAITFSNSADASGHTVTNNSFTSCGQIDPGDVTFSGNAISSSSNALGSLLIDVDGTDNLSDLDFTHIGSPGTGHAIYFPPDAGSPPARVFSFANYTYTGFASVDGSTGNEGLYNNSGGLATISITGGQTPTVRNGAGSSTVLLSAAVTTTITCISATTGLPIKGARVWLNDDGSPITTYIFGIGGELTDANGQVSDIRSTTSIDVQGRARRSSIPVGSPADGILYKTATIVGTIDSATGFTATISMIPDQ